MARALPVTDARVSLVRGILQSFAFARIVTEQEPVLRRVFIFFFFFMRKNKSYMRIYAYIYTYIRTQKKKKKKKNSQKVTKPKQKQRILQKISTFL